MPWFTRKSLKGSYKLTPPPLIKKTKKTKKSTIKSGNRRLSISAPILSNKNRKQFNEYLKKMKNYENSKTPPKRENTNTNNSYRNKVNDHSEKYMYSIPKPTMPVFGPPVPSKKYNLTTNKQLANEVYLYDNTEENNN
jgi:hypothetical protein